MGDRSKKLARYAELAKAMATPPRLITPELPRCHCGEQAHFEINRKSGVTFVCARHLPDDF